MLPTGADVTIAGYDFTLDRKYGQPYLWQPAPKSGGRPDIPGQPGDENLDAGLRRFSFDEWSGGEGNKFYDPSDPTKYDHATAGHGRFAGVFKGTPTRVSASYTPSALGAKSFMVNADGVLWIVSGSRVAGSDHAAFSSNGTTFTTKTLTYDGVGYLTVTAVTGDNKWLYYASTNGAGDQCIRRADSTLTIEEFVHLASPNSNNILAMAVLGPYLYSVSGGGKVRRYDATDHTGLPILPGDASLTIMGSISDDLTVAGTNVGMVSSDTSVFVFVSRSGRTEVHEITSGADGILQPVWGPDGLHGFTATAIGYSNGVILLAGYYGDGTTNRAFLWGLDNASRAPAELGWIRVDTSITSSETPSSIAAADGDEALIGMRSGKVFVYSARHNAISLLDTDASWTRCEAVAAYAGRRLALFANDTPASTDTLEVDSWADDFASTTSSASVVMPAWDLALPHEVKSIDGFHLRFKPLTAGQTITVSYQINESGTFTAMTVVTSTTTDAFGGSAALGYLFLPLSSATATIKAGLLRGKVETAGGVELYSAEVQTRVISFTERWQLALRMTDDTASDRLSDEQTRAYTKRERIRAAIREQEYVAFVDGWYPHDETVTKYDTYTVVVTNCLDVISDGKATGTCLVTLERAAVA